MELDRSLSQSRKSKKLLLLSQETSNRKNRNEDEKMERLKRSNNEFTPERISQRKLQNKSFFILDAHNGSKERGSPFKKKLMKGSSDFIDEINNSAFDNSYHNEYERKKEALKNYYFYNDLTRNFNQKKEMIKMDHSCVNEEEGEILDSETSHRIPNSLKTLNRTSGKPTTKLEVWKGLVEKYEGLIDKMLTKKIKLKDSHKLFQEVKFFYYIKFICLKYKNEKFSMR